MHYLNLGCSVFIALVATTIIYQIKKQIVFQKEILNHYDFIVVGAGTAGCVVAGQIASQSNFSVLLIEAGDEFNLFASIPVAATFFQGSRYDWSFKTAPQKYSSQGMFNQSQAFPRGKGLGGSGQLNYLIHVEPTKNDYNSWVEKNVKSWNYSSLYPYFKRMMKQKEQSFMHISDVKLFSPVLNTAFLTASKNIKNFNAVRPKSTIFEGKRWTSFDGYLKPFLSLPNLHILLNTRVTKILFAGRRAIGVETDLQNTPRIYSETEIILSAGAIQSPQILMLSGVGPAKLLKHLNITVIKDLPGVGQNLHDHLNMPLFVSINKTVSVTADKVQTISEVWKYVTKQEGLLASLPIMALGTKNQNVGLILFGMGSTDEQILREIANYPSKTFRGLFPLYANSSQEGFILLSSCIQPKSRGTVSITSGDYKTPPKIDPNYLENIDDIDCTIQGLNISQTLLASQPFKDLGALLHWPKLSACKSLKIPSNEYLHCIIRTGALTGYHPGGTCKMGKDFDSVVDENLKLIGMNGLRIIDASVLPTPLVQFPNSVIIAIADRAVSIILSK